MDIEFSKYYQDFIKNSLMPKEREDYSKALKTFKLTQETFLELLEDILDNHFIEVDGEIIPDLENLGQSKLIKTLGYYDNTKVKKEQEALKNLNYHLLSLFTVIKNYNFKAGLVDEEYNRKTENANKILFERFAHLNNPPTKDIDFKGQHSFTLGNPHKTEIFRQILFQLKENKLVVYKTSVERFKQIFSGTKIPNEEKVDWIGTKYELLLFLQYLEPKLIVKDKIYYTSLRCFTINGKEILRTEEISSANGRKTKKQIIEEIVSIFKTRT